MDGELPFANEQGVDMYDSIPPLVQTHPFDEWVYCTNCHEAVHGHEQGHQSLDCPYVMYGALDRPQDRLQWARNMPRDGPLADLLTLVDLVGEEMNLMSDFEIHVHYRDLLYHRIHEAMIARFAEHEVEPWRAAMSAFSAFVYQFVRRRRVRPRVIVGQAFSQHMYEGESALDFLRRVAEGEGEIVPLMDFALPLERVETTLLELKVEFDRLWGMWLRSVHDHISADPAILNLNPDDAAWIRKAFVVMLETQPKLVHSQQHIVYPNFPDIDRVVRDEDFEI